LRGSNENPGLIRRTPDDLPIPEDRVSTSPAHREGSHTVLGNIIEDPKSWATTNFYSNEIFTLGVV
jgi:hypothetical protein